MVHRHRAADRRDGERGAGARAPDERRREDAQHYADPHGTGNTPAHVAPSSNCDVRVREGAAVLSFPAPGRPKPPDPTAGPGPTPPGGPPPQPPEPPARPPRRGGPGA